MTSSAGGPTRRRLDLDCYSWLDSTKEIPEPKLLGIKYWYNFCIIMFKLSEFPFDRPIVQSLGAPVEWESPLKQWRCRLAQSRQNEIVSICFNYCAETNPQRIFCMLHTSFWWSYLLICQVTSHINRTWCGNRNWLSQFYQLELISFCTRTYRPTVKCSRLLGKILSIW